MKLLAGIILLTCLWHAQVFAADDLEVLTDPPTDPPTTKPTDAPTTKPTTEATTKATEPPTTKPTEPPTTKPTEPPTTKPTLPPTTKDPRPTEGPMSRHKCYQRYSHCKGRAESRKGFWKCYLELRRCLKGHAFCYQKKDGNYQNLGNCNKYYACVAGKTYIMKCQKHLWFNPKTNECDYRHNVACPGFFFDEPQVLTDEPALEPTTKATTTEATTAPTTKPTAPATTTTAPSTAPTTKPTDPPTTKPTLPPTTKDPRPTEGPMSRHKCYNRYHHCKSRAESKTGFWKCFHELRRCLKGHAFCYHKKDGNYQNLGNCNHYYACVAGKTYIMICQKHLWFNPKTNECDYRHNVACPGFF